MNNKLDNLKKRQSGVTLDAQKIAEKPEKYDKTVTWIRHICLDLSQETQSYDEKITLERINNYRKDNDKMDRLLYSQITNRVFSFNELQRARFSVNVGNLLSYAMENNNVHEDSRKIIIKIYDHFHLALHQIENMNVTVEKSIGETKDKLEDQIKETQREYITILGIFASIVLAFVGGSIFSSSVLENMAEVSIYRLLLTIDFLAFVLINMIYLLIKFICKINNIEKKVFNIGLFNIAVGGLAVLLCLGWLFQIDNIKNILTCLPWI